MKPWTPPVGISGKRAPFRTPDGAEHETWNAARKHLTRLDLIETICTGGCDPVMADMIADRLLESWRVSAKSPQRRGAA